MAASKRPLTPEEAPDTARVYERAKPEAEGGMGRLDNEKGTPTHRGDQALKAPNQHTSRQLNSEEVVNKTGSRPADAGRPQRKSRQQLADEAKAARKRG
jgi:hypothetical protein